MAWTDNAIMFWHNGTTFVKVTDHGRGPLNVSVERIERTNRMVDGTLRRYTVSKKHGWDTSWENIPSTNLKATGKTADLGMAGEDIEAFHNANDGAFQMQLRRGDGTVETFTVMITDFSKEISKRGPNVDLWNLSISLSEV